MTQTAATRIFDELSKFMTSTADAVGSMHREMEAMIRTQTDKWLSTVAMDLVKREDLEHVQEKLSKLTEENEALKKRVGVLEGKSAK